MTRAALAVIVAALLAACASDTAESPDTPQAAPYVLVLGTAQDAGLPQIGCWRACCQAARRDPSKRRLVSSLMLCDPETGGRWLFDATPDLPEQIDVARGHPASRPHTASPVADGPRAALVDGIFITHAHMGHITGLAQLGREAYAANDVPVYGSAAMVELLETGGAWALLTELDHIEPTAIVDGEPVVLARTADGTARLSVTPLSVPHRAELTDTFGFRIDGPTRSLLFIPDIDKWQRWERDLVDELGLVDVALIDGSFSAEGEIPGRSMADIPHPMVSETLALLEGHPELVRRIHFTHFNHTNPMTDSASTEARDVRATGASIASDGDVFAL